MWEPGTGDKGRQVCVCSCVCGVCMCGELSNPNQQTKEGWRPPKWKGSGQTGGNVWGRNSWVMVPGVLGWVRRYIQNVG